MDSIHPYIHRKVVVLNESTPANDAAKAMREKRIGCVLVTDASGRLVGIVTDRDFASRLAADYAVTDVELAEIMTPNVITATTDSRLIDVITLMESHGIRRVPLTQADSSGSQKCAGLITLDDLIASKLIDIHQLSRIVQRQIGRRVVARQEPRRAWAEQRSKARSQQVLRHFYEKCAEKLNLASVDVPPVVNYLLKTLAMRLSFTGAAHLAAQLPKSIQEDILVQPVGPDRSITADLIRKELLTRFHLKIKDEHKLLRQFFCGLESVLEPGEVKHLKAQLPEDLLELFTPISEIVKPDKKQA